MTLLGGALRALRRFDQNRAEMSTGNTARESDALTTAPTLQGVGKVDHPVDRTGTAPLIM
jgi:hypothetical protein